MPLVRRNGNLKNEFLLSGNISNPFLSHATWSTFNRFFVCKFELDLYNQNFESVRVKIYAMLEGGKKMKCNNKMGLSCCNLRSS